MRVVFRVPLEMHWKGLIVLDMPDFQENTNVASKHYHVPTNVYFADWLLDLHARTKRKVPNIMVMHRTES